MLIEGHKADMQCGIGLLTFDISAQASGRTIAQHERILAAPRQGRFTQESKTTIEAVRCSIYVGCRTEGVHLFLE
jgi:hypothetical protein